MAGNILAIFNVSNDVPFPKEMGIKSSYSPHHKFKNVEYLVSGRHQYGDDEVHYPGEDLFVTITFASWEYIKMSLNVGDEFEVREMDRIIGHGKVVTIF